MRHLWAYAALSLALSGCASVVERAAQRRFQATAAPGRSNVKPEAAPARGSLDDYVRFALRNSPVLRAAHERWRSHVLKISGPQRLPAPVVSYSHFLRSIETRVGPQQYRVGVAQDIPWPTTLSAQGEAFAHEARATERLYLAERLRVRALVADSYWRLWYVQEAQRLTKEHDVVLDSLVEGVRARVKTGQASLADLSQIELDVARHHDHRGRHHEEAVRISAQLRSALGAKAAAAPLRADDTPAKGVPAATVDVLQKAAREHPEIEHHAHLAFASESRARAENAKKLPSLRLGLDYIAIGGRDEVPDGGRDAAVAMAALRLPLWWGSASDVAEAERAKSRAH